MTHGLSEGAGMLHFKHRTTMRDEDLYDRGYNRVYDTIELEKNLDDVERILQDAFGACRKTPPCRAGACARSSAVGWLARCPAAPS